MPGLKELLNLLVPFIPYKLAGGDESQVGEIEDNVGTPVNICGFGASLYPFINISMTFDQITDVLNPLRATDPAHFKQLQASFCSHVFEYSCATVS